MRLLFSVDPEIPVPPPLYGGIERIVHALVQEFRRRGHAVGLVCNRSSTCEADLRVAWSNERSRGLLNSAANAATLARTVRRFAPDVVHSFSRLGYLLPILATGVPKVMSYQRHTGGRQIRIAARTGRNLVFTGCSEFIARMGRPWGGSWHAIPNFADVTFYDFSPNPAPEAPLVFLSRLERSKGVHTAIAMARAANRRLVIAGNRVAGEEHERYWREHIEPHVGRDGIEYAGPVDDARKNALLGSAAAMVVPVEWDEPFGIVFAEALACGTPVISCPRGALPEIVVHGTHGFLVDSVAEGVEAIRRIGDISRVECRTRAEELFSVGPVASRYEQLYGSLIGAARGS